MLLSSNGEEEMPDVPLSCNQAPSLGSMNMLIIDMLTNVPLFCCQARSLGSINMRDIFISGPET